MGRGKARIKFNVADMILKDSPAALYIPELVRSPMFPIAVAMFNRAGADNTIRISDVKLLNNAVNEFVVSNKNGIPFARVVNSENDYAIYISTSPLHYQMTKRLTTSNPVYAKNKLKPGSEHDIAATFIAALNGSKIEMSAVLHRAVDNLIDMKIGASTTSSPRVTNMSDDLVTFMARALSNEITFNDIPHGLRVEFDHKYNSFCTKRDKFASAISVAKEFAEGEKMVLIEDAGQPGACVFGTVRSEPILAALDRYVNEGSFPGYHTYNYAEVVTPFAWYPSYEAIPEEHRQQLDFAKVVLSNHNSASNVESPTPTSSYWLAIGAYRIQTNLFHSRNTVINIFTK